MDRPNKILLGANVALLGGGLLVNHVVRHQAVSNLPRSIQNMNAILLTEPVVLANYQWDGDGEPPSDAQCRKVNNALAAAVKAALPAGWSFVAPKSVNEPGRMRFRHGPSNLEWVGIVGLETDTLNEPGILAWVIHCVQPNNVPTDAHTEANFDWAWRDLKGNWAAAVATGTNAMRQLGWELVDP